MQFKSALALASLSIALVGCTTLAPPSTTAQKPGGTTAGVVAAQPAPVAPPPAPALARGEAQQLPPISPVPPPVAGVAAAGLTVIGDGRVKADPDVAYVSAGVQSQGATAREAQDKNTTAMNAVLARIKALGIADGDVKTSGISLHPTFDRDPNKPTGFMANNSVSVTVREHRRAGEILDAAITAGANQSAGVQFGLLNDAAQRRAAIGDAVTAARQRADALAAAAGLRVTGIVSLIDESGGGAVWPMPPNRAMASEMAAAQADVPIQPGQLTITARVRIIYAIQ